MIEKGKHLNIDRSLRLCQFCYSNVIEDKYLFSVCPFYRDLRRKFFKNVHKFNFFMPTKSQTTLKKVAKYDIEAFEKRNFHV